MHFPVRDEVYRFMDIDVRPAIEAVATQLREQRHETSPPGSNRGRWNWKSTTANSRCSATGGDARLPYPRSPRSTRNQRYYRAEVHLYEGGQDYELVGYSRQQIINDIIDQYERHLQFLHLTR